MRAPKPGRPTVGFCFGAVVVGLLTAAITLADEGLRARFERAFEEWVQYIERPEVSVSSDSSTRSNCEPFRRVVALGVPALPLMIEKLDEGREEHWRFFAKAPGTIINRKWKWGETLWGWWETERPKVPEKAKALLSERREALREAEAAARRIREDLGVLALPQVMEEIEQGDAGLVPIASQLTRGALPAEATVEEATAWWEANRQQWTLPEESETQGPATTPPR